MTKERFMFDVPKLYWPRVINPIPNRMRTDGRPFYSITFPFVDLPEDLREFADPVHPRDELEGIEDDEQWGQDMAREQENRIALTDTVANWSSVKLFLKHRERIVGSNHFVPGENNVEEILDALDDDPVDDD